MRKCERNSKPQQRTLMQAQIEALEVIREVNPEKSKRHPFHYTAPGREYRRERWDTPA